MRYSLTKHSFPLIAFLGVVLFFLAYVPLSALWGESIPSKSPYQPVPNPGLQGEHINPADFGLSPDAEPDVNVAALQKALDGGNKVVTISQPGVYRLNKSIFIDDNTVLDCVPGVIFQKDAPYCHVLVNRAALTGGWNTNITLKQVQISANKRSQIPEPGDPLYGVRGQLAIYRARNVEITGFKILDVTGSQYALHACLFDNLLIDQFEIRGDKDGVHIGCGKNFQISNGVCRTYDDAVALNAEDYPTGQPIQGDIENGLIENIIDERLVPTSGICVRLLTGAWAEWHPGIKFQNGDTVSYQGRIYRVNAPFGEEEYVSNNPPTHTEGAWTDPDSPQLQFVYNETSDHRSASIKNITFRNMESYSRTGIAVPWETGPYHRSIHPEVQIEDFPIVDIKVENFKSDTPDGYCSLVNGNSNIRVTMRNVTSNSEILWFRGEIRPINVELTLEDSTVVPGDKDLKNHPDIIVTQEATGKVVLRNIKEERPLEMITGDNIKVVKE